MPLIKCLSNPHKVLEEEERKRQDKERTRKEAEEARRALLQESLYKIRRPTRDKYGRSIIPKEGARVADDVFDPNDPRQVDRKILLTG
eukprot:CAMPEP_0114145386 /NCGR_PEP_ID=MMETSP0043_2-20121206/20022_1 /TAXON_ID=464988 /ORGANISM="Hemiselmis andersenii, Strain CCMP644" /LENGTH=87 /DNA_ID=CAMNT_0001239807 /DNA_START=33 /DNA_END=293 /DNA_ORIENTATION=+